MRFNIGLKPTKQGSKMIEYKQVPTDQVERLPPWVDSSDPAAIANHHKTLYLLKKLNQMAKQILADLDNENQ
jgi:hypothetical protein